MTKFTIAKIVLVCIISLIIANMVNNYLVSLNEEEEIFLVNSEISKKTIIDRDQLSQVGIRKKDKALLFPDALIELDDDQIIVSLENLEDGNVLENGKNVIVGTKEELIEKGIIAKSGDIENDYFLTPSSRLVALEIGYDTFLGSKIKAGDYVDVILTTTELDMSYSAMISQHMKVFEMNAYDNDEKASNYEVFLQATPQEAVELVHAKNTGKIDLVLNPQNGYEEFVSPVNTGSLLNKGVKGRSQYEDE